MVPSSPRESVLKCFEEKYGNAPEYLVRAPGRLRHDNYQKVLNCFMPAIMFIKAL